LIDIAYTRNGRTARIAESAVKKALKQLGIPTGRNAFRVDEFDGYTEAFHNKHFQVNSLVELFEKLSLAVPKFIRAGRES